jgi:hypothetical protein
MNAVVNTLNNFVAAADAKWSAQEARLAALERQVSSAADMLPPIAAAAEQATSVIGQMTNYWPWWLALQVAAFLFAPAAASHLLSFVRRKENPVIRFLGGAVAFLMSPVSTGFMLLGSVILKGYRSCCGRPANGEASADPEAGVEAPRDEWLEGPFGRYRGGGGEFADVDRIVLSRPVPV